MHCNILNLLGLNFDFCDFCGYIMIRYSLFYQLHKTKVSYSIGLAAFQASGWADT
jgi:hypothetical protein